MLSMLMGISTVEATDTNLNFNLTHDGENTVTVKSGDVITVVCNLENSSEEDYMIRTVANEIYFDDEFFEYLGDDQIEKGTYIDTAKLNVRSWGERRVYFNGSRISGVDFSNKHFIGSFKLKVTAKSGSSIISSKAISAYDGDGVKYDLTSTNLTVFVGGEPKELFNVTYIHDGKEYKTVMISGEMTVDSSPAVISGYTFLGWENKENGNIYKASDKFNVNSNTVFTSKWKKIVVEDDDEEVSDKKSDSNVTKYTLTFQTNGGTSIRSVSHIKNTTVTLSKYVTEKDGFIFAGWYTDKKLTEKVTKVKMVGNITVYAKWIADEDTDVTSGSDNDTATSYKPSIFKSEHRSYIVGRENGYFYPEADLTRAEAAEILYRLLDDDVRKSAHPETSLFNDVYEYSWFYTSVTTLAKLNIINGRTHDTFAPDDRITRAEFTTMIARIADIEFDCEDDMFADISDHWARTYINKAASIGWVNGDNGVFRPDDSITRAEVVTLINRVLERVPESKDDLLEGMITPPDNTDESKWYYLAVQEAVNSHDFEIKEDGIHEIWMMLKNNSD